MAIYNNAELAKQIFHGNLVGSVREGALADLILVNYQPFTQVTPENLPWHILFGFQESMISATMVGGEFLMKDGKLLYIDEERIVAKALEISAKVWDRYQSQF
jgi:cytosine/adenosine deaminase-related metal-dependent hydrolase